MSDHQLVIVPELFIDQPVNLAAILTMTYSVILETDTGADDRAAFVLEYKPL